MSAGIDEVCGVRVMGLVASGANPSLLPPQAWVLPYCISPGIRLRMSLLPLHHLFVGVAGHKVFAHTISVALTHNLSTLPCRAICQEPSVSVDPPRTIKYAWHAFEDTGGLK